MNVVKNLFSMIEYPKEGILSKVINKSDNYHYTLMCLAKGTDIDTHTSTKAGTVQVLSGKGIFTLHDEKIVMEKGVFIIMPKDAPHALYAEENTTILLTLVG